jgi:hypothetical protein
MEQVGLKAIGKKMVSPSGQHYVVTRMCGKAVKKKVVYKKK